MTYLICANDGSSAWPSAIQHRLGFVGLVNFCTCANAFVVHECLRIRDTRAEALLDASGDAKKLMEMWCDQVSIDPR